MHIPVRLGLVGDAGRALPLTLEGENATGPDERVLELTESEQTFVFVDVDEPPLSRWDAASRRPSCFKTPLDRRARAALMARDRDAFNRWEAGQTLAREACSTWRTPRLRGARAKPDSDSARRDRRSARARRRGSTPLQR